MTVFITGLILMQYGSGPVKGFAVTLGISDTFSVISVTFNNWRVRKEDSGRHIGCAARSASVTLSRRANG